MHFLSDLSFFFSFSFPCCFLTNHFNKRKNYILIYRSIKTHIQHTWKKQWKWLFGIRRATRTNKTNVTKIKMQPTYQPIIWATQTERARKRKRERMIRWSKIETTKLRCIYVILHKPNHRRSLLCKAFEQSIFFLFSPGFVYSFGTICLHVCVSLVYICCIYIDAYTKRDWVIKQKCTDNKNGTLFQQQTLQIVKSFLILFKPN